MNWTLAPRSRKIRNIILYTILGIICFGIFVLGPIFVIYAIRHDCNIAHISLKGTLYTYYGQGGEEEPTEATYETSSENVVAAIENANYDSSINGIILEVDSYGGSPVAGEEIANALFNSTKPTVAYIRQGGASAAYWAASGAEAIYGSENSDIGSIGSTMSYLDEVAYNEKEGYRYNQLSSGKFKDIGSPDKPLTEEERQLLMRDVNITRDNFVRAVARNRDIPIEEVDALADGSAMLGAMAMKNKLIDGIGGLNEAVDYITSRIDGQAKICWEQN